MIETIKDYLVSLGFAVDKGSYNEAKKAVDSVGGSLTKFASEAAFAFGKAALAVTGFMVAGKLAIDQFLNGLGDQEIQMEKLSRQLWTTQQQAMAFSATLKALGANLQDLYLSPTLMSQYNQLHAVAQEMQTPGDYNGQIQLIQSVSLQIKQMRLEAYYALQWIGYYFIKYMSGPITNVRNVLQSINQVIIKNMPTWTKRVAEVMASFVQAGVHIIQALTSVYQWLQKMLQYVPGWAKGIAAALAVVSVSNPFTLMIEAIGGAILLLDDIETYMHGGQSAMSPFWTWLVKVNGEFTKMNKTAKVGDQVNTTFSKLAKVFQGVGTWFLNMVDTLTKNGTFTAYLKSMLDLFNSVGSLVGSAAKALGDLFGVLSNSKNKSSMQNFGQMMTDIIGLDIKLFSSAIEEIAGLIQLASDALAGDWKGAGTVLRNLATGQNLANAGIIPQSSVIGSSYSYAYPKTTHTTTSSKTVHAPMTITNHIHGASDPNAASRAWYSGFERQGMMIVDAFRGLW